MRFLPALLGASLALSAAATPLLQQRDDPPAASPTHESEFTMLGCPNTTSPIASEDEQFDAANDYADLLYVQKDIPGAFSKYVATDLINHAPLIPGDGAALAEYSVSSLVNAQIELQKVVFGQDIATTFFKSTTAIGVVAAMELFRMSGTCIVEVRFNPKLRLSRMLK